VDQSSKSNNTTTIIKSNGGTFDKEMQKHGLMNDLKKLDSFN
jgi:hypothetical protein